MIEKLSFRLLPFFATILLAAACQELEPVTATEQEANPVSERATVPFSLTVHTEGTKVSYADGTYQFKAGDKLHVVGLGDRTDIYGDLTQNGNIWSGVLSYLVEKGQPAGNTPLKVTLIHSDNTDVSTYASAIVGTVPEGSTALQEAVEHYSLFTTNDDEVTLTTEAATLHQRATFLDVTVTFLFDGSRPAEGGEALVDLTTTLGSTTEKTRFIALPDGQNFKVNFMAVIPGGQTISDFTLTIGDRMIEFGNNSATLASNKKYNVNREIDFRPQLGDPLWSDGTYGRLLPADPDTYIVGIIVYVNHNYTDPDKAAIDDAITEKDAGFGHGLVMALHNAAKDVPWSDSTGKVKCTDNFVTKPKQTLLAANLSGYTNTNSIISTLGDGAVSAASRAKAYPVEVPSNTTGWFLPTIGQWMYTISTEGFGGVNPVDEWFTVSGGTRHNWLNEGNISGDLVFVKECDADRVNMMIKVLNDRLELLKNDFSDYNLTYDSFGDPSGSNNISDNYWTSSENSNNNAIRMNLGTVEKNNNIYYSTLKARLEDKEKITVYTLNNIQYKMKVRSFLAF
ncbi:MAG: hypothetical protein IJK19_00695 [Bacteroidales bacterium]|nr:hypothetical protein [Bacteroidales bacterium]